MYLLIVVMQLFNKRNGVIFINLACVAFSGLLFFVGKREERWMSNLCFSIGVTTACYPRIGGWIEKRVKDVKWIVAMAVLFALVFCFTYLPDGFVNRVAGNALLCIILVVLTEAVSLGSSVGRWIGACSLELYLIHIGIVAYFLEEQGFSSKGVALVALLSVVFTIIAHHVVRLIKQRI